MKHSTRVAIAELAAGQHGAISLEQLRALGVTDDQRRTLFDRGHLLVAQPRVYRTAGAPDTLAQRQWVGLLCLGRRAVLSHEAGARAR